MEMRDTRIGVDVQCKIIDMKMSRVILGINVVKDLISNKNTKRYRMKKTVVLIAVVLFLFACFEQINPIQTEQSIAIQFMKSAEIDVTSATCRVSADDMDTMFTTLTVTPTMISGEILAVPYGADRLFEIMCYNSDENMNYYGSALVDINSLAPVVDIILYQVDSSANVTIRGTFADTVETEEKIIFTADWSGNFNIYIMDIDGTNIKQITSSSYSDIHPSLSPDRQKIVFQRPSEVGYQGYIVDVNTLEVTTSPLLEYNPQQLKWHSDGDKLLFYSGYNGGYPDIFEYDMETEQVRCIIEDPYINWGPNYSPDGEKLIYYSNKSGTFKAYIANLDGSDSQLCISNNNCEERSPQINPLNNNLLVFAGRGYDTASSSQFGLFIFNRLTGNIQTLISTIGVNEVRPIWSPDGNYILYQHYDGGNYGLYIINADGTQNKPLVDTNGNEMYPHWR